MANPIKEFKKGIEDLTAKREYKRDSQHRILIEMTVRDDSDFLSVFSASEIPVISSDVAEFIEISTHSLPPQEPLTLRIHSDCIDDEEKVLYRKAIHEHYIEKFIAVERELKRNRWIAFGLFCAGVAALVFGLYFEYHYGALIWSEVIDIVAWVFLWEAVDISAFQNRAYRTQEMHYLSYLSMNVEYLPLTNEMH